MKFLKVLNGNSNTVLSLNIINVLNDKPALDVRGFLLGGSGVVPQSYGEAYGRGFRLTGSYNF